MIYYWGDYTVEESARWKNLWYSPSPSKSFYQMIQMLEIWQTFVDKFYNFLDELLNWRFNPRQNIGQIKLSAGDFQFKDERNNFTQMWLKKNANIIFHNSNRVSTGLYKLVIGLPRTAPSQIVIILLLNLHFFTWMTQIYNCYQ